MEVGRTILNQVGYAYEQFRRVRTWQLLIIIVLSGFVTATFLRLNNIGMAQRREAVLMADKEARDADASTRMYDLQRYVATHMNADTGQFNLKEQYRRDYQKAVDAVSNDSNPNGNIFAKAQEVCRQIYPNYQSGSYLAYQQCTINELDKYPSAPELKSSLELPNPALYRHSFASPLWSADFAGFSLLFFLIVVMIVLCRWLQKLLFYGVLKLRKSGIR